MGVLPREESSHGKGGKKIGAGSSAKATGVPRSEAQIGVRSMTMVVYSTALTRSERRPDLALWL